MKLQPFREYRWIPAIPLLVLCSVMLLLCRTAPAEDFRPNGIPVLYLHIDGGGDEIRRMQESEDHSYMCTGTADLVVPDGYGGQESVAGLTVEYIRGRGNTTWRAEKKPYKIKFAEKQDFFGMGGNKHWVLLANYFDNSLLRNRLTSWLGQQLGLAWTPESVPVDVVMNGVYLGSYCLSEQVRVDKGRIEIDELTEDVSGIPEIYGGYLLALYSELSETTPEADVFTTAHDVSFVNDTPSFAADAGGYENPRQMNYIRDYVQRTEDAIFSADGMNSRGEHYAELMDIPSVIDYWWIQEASINQDGLGTPSTYLYKPRFDGRGGEGPLYFGPLWDFDLAWGNHMYQRDVEVTGFNHAKFGWTDELRQRPEYVEQLRARWSRIDQLLARVTRPGGLLDQWKKELRDSWEDDFALWGTFDPDWEIAEDGPLVRSFEEETGRLRSWIDARRAWITAHLDEIGKVYCWITARGEGLETRTMRFYRDSEVDTEYSLGTPERDGFTFDGWFDQDSRPAPDYFIITGDMVYTARFSRSVTDPSDYDQVAVPADTFTFTKRWEGGSEKSIDFTLYKQGETVYRHGFDKKVISRTEWRYNAWFSEAAACYVIEKPVKGYRTRYENVGVYADVTDRCCDGGTIVNYRVPETRDNGRPFLWAGCAAAGLAVLAAALCTGKRKKPAHPHSG